jgi:hypothetical protein
MYDEKLFPGREKKCFSIDRIVFRWSVSCREVFFFVVQSRSTCFQIEKDAADKLSSEKKAAAAAADAVKQAQVMGHQDSALSVFLSLSRSLPHCLSHTHIHAHVKTIELFPVVGKLP